MVAHYMVVKYFPDPRSEEQVYVGVVAWDETDVRYQFLRDWRRVEHFAGKDVAPVRDVTEEIERRLKKEGRAAIEELKKAANQWIYSVQLSQPRGALCRLDELWDEVSTWLQKRESRERGFRDKRAAAKVASEGLRAAFAHRLGEKKAQELVRQRETVPGRLERHEFDIVVKNDRIFAAAEALSFELPRGETLRHEIDALKWTLSDTLAGLSELSVAVVVLAPKPHSPRKVRTLYQETRSLLQEGFGVTVVEETEVLNWARALAERLEPLVASKD